MRLWDKKSSEEKGKGEERRKRRKKKGEREERREEKGREEKREIKVVSSQLIESGCKCAQLDTHTYWFNNKTQVVLHTSCDLIDVKLPK